VTQHKTEEGAAVTVVYANEREKAKSALAEMLGQHSEELWPLLELVRELKVTLDDVFDGVGRVCVERVLELSAEQVAGSRHQGKATGEIRWHGSQEGVVTLSTQKIRVKKPRLRKKSGGRGGEVSIPAYEAMQREEGLRQRLVAVMLQGLPLALRRCLATTNLESSHAGMRLRTRRVTHWQDGQMILRWAAAAYLQTEKNFRRIMGYRDLWILAAALRPEHTRVDAADEANNAGALQTAAS
jgi:hypothetical protein